MILWKSFRIIKSKPDSTSMMTVTLYLPCLQDHLFSIMQQLLFRSFENYPWTGYIDVGDDVLDRLKMLVINNDSGNLKNVLVLKSSTSLYPKISFESSSNFPASVSVRVSSRPLMINEQWSLVDFLTKLLAILKKDYVWMFLRIPSLGTSFVWAGKINCRQGTQ